MDSKRKSIIGIVTSSANDKTITVTALDEIRKNYKLKFKDSKLKKIYKEYIDEQIEQAEKQGQTNTQ